MTKCDTESGKRPYELGKRLEQMDQSRAAILRAAQALLVAQGFRKLTMESLAAESGVTRQTIHNLFGNKAGVLEGLFDLIALEGGMERMRETMMQPPGEAQLAAFVTVFCDLWRKNRILLRRVHGIGAIDPEFGEVIEARNRRRLTAATRILGGFKKGKGSDQQQKSATLTALTSFEFYDALVEGGVGEANAADTVLRLARSAVGISE